MKIDGAYYRTMGRFYIDVEGNQVDDNVIFLSLKQKDIEKAKQLLNQLSNAKIELEQFIKDMEI